MAEQYTSQRGIRLVFEYDEAGVRLIFEQPVEMAILEEEDASRPPRDAGMYLDTRDANESTLSRTRVEGAFTASLEVFPEDPIGPITRVNAPRRRGAFTVVIPASEVADHVALLNVPEGEPPDDSAARGAVPQMVEVARFRLRRQR